MSATYGPDSRYPTVSQGLEGLSAGLFADTPVGEAFRQHTADPDAFDAYIEKMKVLGRVTVDRFDGTPLYGQLPLTTPSPAINHRPSPSPR